MKWKIKPACTSCGRELDAADLWCIHCGGLVAINKIFSPQIKNKTCLSMWDFQDFLPKFTKIISQFEGNTPILPIRNIDQIKNVNLKLEYRNPVGTFRDRASSLIISDATSNNKNLIVNASTGSFGISISSYAARANLKTINVIPKNIDLSKIEQMKIYNSEVIVKGDYLDDAIEEATKISKDKNAYLPLPHENILTIEGQKTISLEIALHCFQNKKKIDSVIVPRGSGSLVLSIYRGFEDAKASELIDQIPKIYSVALKRTYGSHFVESLEIQKPALLSHVSAKIKKTGGKEIHIEPLKIIEDALQFAKYEGIFLEPASSSVISAVKLLVSKGTIEPKTTYCIITGTGINALNLYASQMRNKKRVIWGLSSSSTTKFEILNLIAEKKAQYGYAIWAAMGKNYSKQLIYQHLTELEKKEYIQYTLEKRNKKKYILTKKGIEFLEKMKDLADYI
ncbi:MAG: pyridoxal-phosphate dependent enzyme [Promethearchaeota archaeon]